MGIVKAICVSDTKGIQKKSVDTAFFDLGYGIRGDASGYRDQNLYRQRGEAAYNNSGRAQNKNIFWYWKFVY